MTGGGPPARIDFGSHTFQPVVHLPERYEVLDFTGGQPASRFSGCEFSIGRYDEDRAIYTDPLFEGGRSIHVGIDIGGPVGTPVHAFVEGEIFKQGENRAPGDYGPTIVTRHVLDGVELWALHGHLSRTSLSQRKPGERFEAGALLGWIGDEDVNGGWPPHLHFQLSYRRPQTHDLPGVVTPEERTSAIADFPDPRAVLGPLY